MREYEVRRSSDLRKYHFMHGILYIERYEMVGFYLSYAFGLHSRITLLKSVRRMCVPIEYADYSKVLEHVWCQKVVFASNVSA